MAKLTKEATKISCVLEPMFHFFDSGKRWPLQNGLALCVLYDMQHLMEKLGNIYNLTIYNPYCKLQYAKVKLHWLHL